MLHDLFGNAGMAGFNLGLLAGQGLPLFVAATVAVENGFLVISQRLESYQVEQPKMANYLRMRPPISGETWKGEGDEAEMETVTKHAVRWATVFCADLKAVAEAQAVANAEREKIRAWHRDRRGKEYGPTICG
jgi:hypothetical protein